MTDDAEIEQVWRDFWVPILYRDGALDLEQLKKELLDYRTVMREVSLVYDELTGAKISKCNTNHKYVIDAAWDHFWFMSELSEIVGK